MYRISKLYTFAAAHQLGYLPDDHPCSRLHGHNYTVEVHLTSDHLNLNDFVMDFNALDRLMEPIITAVDHHDLNFILGSRFRTTSENLAKLFFDRLQTDIANAGVILEKVRVSETSKTWAEYTP